MYLYHSSYFSYPYTNSYFFLGLKYWLLLIRKKGDNP